MIDRERTSCRANKKRQKTFAVAGPDLDIGLCQTLSIGDQSAC